MNAKKDKWREKEKSKEKKKVLGFLEVSLSKERLLLIKKTNTKKWKHRLSEKKSEENITNKKKRENREKITARKLINEKKNKEVEKKIKIKERK